MTRRISRTLAFALLFAVALSFLVAAHYYIALRLVIAPLDGAWRSAGLAGIFLLGVSLVALPIAERKLQPKATRWIAWPASLWMGAAFWLLLLLPALDLLGLLFGASAQAAQGDAVATQWQSGRAALALGLTGAALGLGLRSALSPPRLVRERFEIENWPAALDGFRIVQISDVHIGPILGSRFAEHLVRRIERLEPDLIAVTGDLVDGRVSRLAEEVAPLAELHAPHGVFFVTGNHDHYSGAADWVECVRELGMQPLRNRRVEVGDASGCFDLVGVDDHHAHLTGGGREDLSRALAGRNPSRPAVLLAHDPNTFKQARSEAIDLQLSGHTHGGQIWPFAWFVRLATPFVAGRYRAGRAQLYVSRGTGFWGPPLRLGSPAEITEITLARAREA